MVKGGVEGVDTKEFKSVMDGYDGYDTYKIDNARYVRFNTSAFVSNYKRNDLLITRMTLYCIPVGEFEKDKFDFMKQLSKMEDLIYDVNQRKTLADVYPPPAQKQEDTKKKSTNGTSNGKLISLYDVVYACINSGDKK